MGTVLWRLFFTLFTVVHRHCFCLRNFRNQDFGIWPPNTSRFPTVPNHKFSLSPPQMSVFVSFQKKMEFIPKMSSVPQDDHPVAPGLGRPHIWHRLCGI